MAEVNSRLVLNGELRALPGLVDRESRRTITIAYEELQLQLVPTMNRVCHHLGLTGCPPDSAPDKVYATAVLKGQPEDLRESISNFDELEYMLGPNGSYPSPCVLPMLLAAGPGTVFPQCPLLVPRAAAQ